MQSETPVLSFIVTVHSNHPILFLTKEGTMKRIIVIAMAFVLAAGIGSAFAAGGPQAGTMGISVGMGDSVFGHRVLPGGGVINDVVDITGKYFMAQDMAVTAGFGLQVDGGDADATYISFSVGARKYLKTADFAPFFGGRFTFAKVEDDVAGTDVDLLDLEAHFGAEYFFSNQFSMEGAVGFGIGQLSFGNADDTYFGTRTLGVKASFYF
jgi:hypothetical protein